MSNFQDFVRLVKRDAALIQEIDATLASLSQLHSARLEVKGTKLVLNLRSDIQRLRKVLSLLSYTDGE